MMKSLNSCKRKNRGQDIFGSCTCRALPLNNKLNNYFYGHSRIIPQPQTVSLEETTIELVPLLDQFYHLSTQTLIHPHILRKNSRLPYHKLDMSATKEIASFQALLFRY